MYSCSEPLAVQPIQSRPVFLRAACSCCRSQLVLFDSFDSFERDKHPAGQRHPDNSVAPECLYEICVPLAGITGQASPTTCDGARLSSHGPDNRPSQPKSSHPEKSALSSNGRHACLPAQSAKCWQRHCSEKTYALQYRCRSHKPPTTAGLLLLRRPITANPDDLYLQSLFSR